MNKFFIQSLFFYLTIILNVSAQNTVNYIASTAVISNPERGLQKYSITNSSYNTSSNYSNLSENTLRNWRTSDDRITVIFRYFLLSNFLSQDINQTYLSNMQNDFNIIRNAGLKCIVRFSYSNGITSSPQQPALSQILTHLDQLKPMLETNKDVILTHQAGFLGTWGEWYYTNSPEFGTEGNVNQQQWDNRKEIIDGMLAATPVTIPLQVRYPGIKKRMYGSSELTNSTAYQNTPNARIGFFNDAFLNNWGDQGTYSVSNSSQNPIGTADYEYLSNETNYTPMTGETNGLNPPRTDASNAVLEMDMTNWTTLNRDYYTPNWNNWIDAGKYTEILSNLGYRFVLKSSTINVDERELTLKIELSNVGFAPPFKARDVFLILKNQNTNEVSAIPLNTDIRTWKDSTISIDDAVDVSSLTVGSYDAYLHLPDPNENLSTRPEYSIRFANENTWINENGFNDLLQTVEIAPLLGSTENLMNEKNYNLYPNPISSYGVLSLTNPIENAKLIILNSKGEIVKEIEEVNGTTIKFNCQQLNSGIHHVLLLKNDQIIISEKIQLNIEKK